ncbi:MAG: hypothetical protein H0X25_13680 [Acidobacteriales bacterium]|nr:hypothetical protein [Terriglobales bacterium]
MNSDKAWYWIAVGTLAVILGNTLLSASADRLQCAMFRSVATARRLGDIALSEVDRLQASVAPLQPAMLDGVAIRNQAVEQVQVELMRRQAELAELQAMRPRLAEVRTFSQSWRACPRRNVSIRVATDGEGSL